ncbi:hypothetical protein BKG89_02945 [Rodentibacter caecimuris]|uniref:Maltose regulon periplasmic protein n=1 Tax=Rodentibacter caecimuris TaxID=1796644 RepID=A0ABX3L2L6_9PAST|nr:hypothetical protein BKG89_02945 [Rodentibacter heylii]
MKILIWVFSIKVSATNGTKFIGIPTQIFSTNKKTQNIGATQSQSLPITKQAIHTPIDKDTEAYFNQAVSQALKQNNINRALNLVNEAEKLGLTSPRKIFLKQVSSK